jgi:hypothetical protein
MRLREEEMFRRSIVFLACMPIFFFIFACTKNPKFIFPQGTRVGIINLLESDATHTNFSSFGQDNFTKTYAVDWRIPSYAERQLITQLKKNTDLTSVEINVSDPSKQKALRLNMIERVILSETAPPTIPPEGARLLQTISDPENVQVVIIIGSYSGPSAHKGAENPIFLEGYGLFTRILLRGIFERMFGGLLSFRKAYAFAQIGVLVFRVQPVLYIGSSKTSSQGRPLRPLTDFDWDADIHNLPETELAKAKPKIEQSIDEALEKALNDTRLAPSGASLEDTGPGTGGAPAR